MTEVLWQYDPVAFQRELIVDDRELSAVVARLSPDSAIGVDLEMAQRVERKPGGIQEWKQVLALIQIASHEYSVVIDPVRCRDLTPLKPLLAGKTRKVFLGGGQDAALLEKAGIPARNIVDVGEVALAIFGRRQDGMAALAERIFGISLDKSVRRADWLARPLNPVLLAYAHRDAELTLLIYDWFRLNYPEVSALHEREILDPVLPAVTPAWLKDAFDRAAADAVAVVMEHDLDPARDSGPLAEDVRAALKESCAPRQMSRLLRIAGELGLRDVLPDVLPLVDSPSSVIRGAAARAIGQLADRQTGGPILKQLKADPIDDVKKAAEAGQRDLKAQGKAVPVAEADEEPQSSLGDNALSALRQLMAQMGEE